MNNKGKNTGISLIVLVITIIVIVILAVAVILTVAKNNPIENAKVAVESSDEATLREAANAVYASLYAEEKKAGNEINDKTMTEKVQEALEEQGFKTTDVNRVKIENGNVVVSEKTDDTPTTADTPVIPNGFVASQATGETDVDTGLVIYEGTEAVTDNNVDTARTTRNQFVWVPVDNMDEFVRTTASDTSYSEPHSEADESSIEVTDYNAMMESVEKYGGFYIARYEASKGSDGKAKSVKNATPWVSIKWGASMTDYSGGAVEASRAVYPVESATETKDPVSTLIYGVQYDATARWLEKNYPGISSDSTGYGNYATGSVINTGSNESYKTNNIYDLAGNVDSWTMEAHSTNYRVPRGGYYGNPGYVTPSSSRIFYADPRLSLDYIGIVFSLYIK